MADQKTIEEMIANFQATSRFDTYCHVMDMSQPTRNIEETFSYLWNMKKAHLDLTPTIVAVEKCDTGAEVLREEGNQLFQKRNFESALRCYNLSIMHAPHPPCSENISCQFQANDQDEASAVSTRRNSSKGKNKAIPCLFAQQSEGKYRSLALGFANRSAVLYELEQYEKSLADIDLALWFGYPKNLHYKLATRKAKCLLAVGKVDVAKELLQNEISSMKTESMNKTRYDQTKASLLHLIEQCDSADSPVCNDQSNLTQAERLLFSYKLPRPPKLSHRNSAYTSLSKSVTVKYSQSVGRHVVATKEIHPGN